MDVSGKASNMEANQAQQLQNEVQQEVQQEVQPDELAAGSVAHSGNELVRTLLSSTGLPESLVGEEFGTILESTGHSASTLTLEQLRAAMLAYLETTFASDASEDCEEAAAAEAAGQA